MGTEGLTKNLQVQIKKIIDQTNRGGHKSRAVYKNSYNQFAKFLAERYRLQKIANVKDKHIVAYAKYRIEKGKAGSTIISELSGIRFIHGLSGSKNVLPENAEIERRIGVPFPEKNSGKVDRSWTQKELDRAKDVATSMGRTDVVIGMDISRSFGLRIEELSRLRVSQVRNALENGYLHVKGKGGKERDIPIRNVTQRETLSRALDYARTHERSRLGDYILSNTQKGGVRSQMKSLQNWIINHRDKFQDTRHYLNLKNAPESRQDGPQVKEKVDNISWHGLRHSFAAERYFEALDNYLAQGKEQVEAEYQARVDVSYELGHFRDSITLVYLP